MSSWVITRICDQENYGYGISLSGNLTYALRELIMSLDHIIGGFET